MRVLGQRRISVGAAQRGRQGSRYPSSLMSVVRRCFRIVVVGMERSNYFGRGLAIKLGEGLMKRVLKEAVV